MNTEHPANVRNAFISALAEMLEADGMFVVRVGPYQLFMDNKEQPCDIHMASVPSLESVRFWINSKLRGKVTTMNPDTDCLSADDLVIKVFDIMDPNCTIEDVCNTMKEVLRGYSSRVSE